MRPEIVYKINGKFQTKFPKKEIRLGHKKIETYISISSLRAFLKDKINDPYRLESSGDFAINEILEWLQQEVK